MLTVYSFILCITFLYYFYFVILYAHFSVYCLETSPPNWLPYQWSHLSHNQCATREWILDAVVCIVCAAEPAHATSAESPGAIGRRSNGSTADGPSSPGASGREARSPSSGSATTAPTTTTTNSGDASAAQGQLNKLKRFLATVQQFADDIAPDIGDRVRTLVLALVVSSMSASTNLLFIT